MPLHPVVDPDIFALRPDFVALSLSVEGACNAPSDALAMTRNPA